MNKDLIEFYEKEKIIIEKNTLLFLLDKVEECYKAECEKIVKKILDREENKK